MQTWIIRRDNMLLVNRRNDQVVLPQMTFDDVNYLFTKVQMPQVHAVSTDWMAAFIKGKDDQIHADIRGFSKDLEWLHPRAALAEGLVLGVEDRSIFFKALGIIEWMENHQYCGRCGSKNRLHNFEKAYTCSKCEKYYYPTVSPSILVRITKGDEILLARSKHFKPNLYSNIAGFLELNESAEECVHREVFEEVGIRIHNVQYFGSQYWPFPNSFMLAFTAQYLSGDLVLCPKEIEDAKWFKRESMPLLPLNFSISGQLIEDFIRKSPNQT